MGGRAWKPEDIAELRRVYETAGIEPVHAAELGKRLGRSAVAVVLYASRLGLCMPMGKRRRRDGGAKSRRKFATDAERHTAVSKARRDWLAEHGHPRGMLGKRHSSEAKAAFRDGVRRAWADPASKYNSEALSQVRSQNSHVSMLHRMRSNPHAAPGYSRGLGGMRADLGIFVRSRWEANYARYLNLLKSRCEIQGWRFEPKTFVFEKISRGTRSYTPDFEVTLADGTVEWHEVKGWMDPKSKTKLARMARYFPTEKIHIIGKAWFVQARRGGLAAILPHWESWEGRSSRKTAA